jgi:hypothetical protein
MPSGMSIWVGTRSPLSEVVRHAAMSRIKGGAPLTPQSTASDNLEAGVGGLAASPGKGAARCFSDPILFSNGPKEVRLAFLFLQVRDEFMRKTLIQNATRRCDTETMLGTDCPWL